MIMKKLILALFAISTILTLTSCGSDDPEKVKKEFNATILYPKELKAFGGTEVKTTMDAKSLEDLLKGTAGYDGSEITSCVLSTPDCRATIKGLKPGITLNKLTLVMGSLKKEIGDITSIDNEPISLRTNETDAFFQQVFAKIAKDRKIEEIQIIFTPSADLEPQGSVKLELSLKGTFTYWQVVE